MKRMILIACLWMGAVPFAARADHEIDWTPWYEGDVQVRLRVDRGEGGLYELGRPVRLKLEANEDAYHLVYAIDTDGYVRLLFPRPWEDDGWLFAHEEMRLDAHDLAWPAERWGAGGIVYVEAVASPVPFDFTAMGVVFRAGNAGWVRQGRPFRVQGDPFLAFNEMHRILFPDWEQAAFAVDYTYFYVDQMRDAPRYLGYTYQRVYVPPPAPVFSVGLRFVWHWEFGRRYCRPVYGPYYLPGRHVVHHDVHRHHHVVYQRTPLPPAHRRPAAIPWVAPERKRVAQEPPVVWQRQRSVVEPRRERQRGSLPRVERPRSSRFVAEASRQSVEKRREAPARRSVERNLLKRDEPTRRSNPPAAQQAQKMKKPAAKEVQRREAKPRQEVKKAERREKAPSKSQGKSERNDSGEKQRKRR